MKRTFLALISMGSCVPFGVFDNSPGAPELTAVTYPAGIYPRAIAIGDLNNDGFPDVVTANDDSDDVSVFFNDETGGLLDALSFAAGENPLSVDLGDLDQDGDLDIAVGTFHFQGPGQVSLLFNDGTGAFSAPQALAYESNTMGANIAVFDINTDGLLDIISQSASDTSVFLAQGVGAFGQEQRYSDAFFHYGFAIGDLNLDGAPDLVTGGFAAKDNGLQDNGFHLRVNQAGALQTPTLLENRDVPNAMALGDLNGDGILDIATSFETANKIEALIGTGNSFTSSQREKTGENPNGLALADLNGDGTLDIITSDYNSQDVGLLLNDGTARFGRVIQYSIGASPMRLAAADLNGDGKSDIVTANPADNSITVLLNAPGPVVPTNR